MDIKDILATEDLSERIRLLKCGRNKPLPDIDAIKKEWVVRKHRTMTDTEWLPDKIIKNDDGSVKKVQKVNRIALPMQKKIVNTAVCFAFGTPYNLNANPSEGDETLIYNAVKKIASDTKLNSFTRKGYRELLRATEFAELWYATGKPEAHNFYGFKTKLKIRVSPFNPFSGDKLFPYFDETGDMIAFSREFCRYDEKNKPVTYFETYTDTTKYLWKQDGNEWVEVKAPAAHNIGKIPVSYVTQDAVEWKDVQIIIERLEFLLSKFAETNDYHGAPALFFKGKGLTMPDKSEAGKVWQGEGENADVKVISWDKAPESIKLEIETDLRFIYGLTQTPDVSFDSVKGLSAISGTALEMLLMDAHLKVQEKKEILDEFLQRRVNIQKRMIGMISGKLAIAENLEIEPEIIPFKINDETTTIQNISTAVGAGIASKKTGVKMLNWVSDTDQELEEIQKEENENKVANAFD